MASMWVQLIAFNAFLSKLNNENTIQVCQMFQKSFGNQIFKQLIFFGACKIANFHDIDKQSWLNLINTVQYVLHYNYNCITIKY